MPYNGLTGVGEASIHVDNFIIIAQTVFEANRAVNLASFAVRVSIIQTGVPNHAWHCYVLHPTLSRDTCSILLKMLLLLLPQHSRRDSLCRWNDLSCTIGLDHAIHLFGECSPKWQPCPGCLSISAIATCIWMPTFDLEGACCILAAST